MLELNEKKFERKRRRRLETFEAKIVYHLQLKTEEEEEEETQRCLE